MIRVVAISSEESKKRVDEWAKSRGG